MSQNNSWGKVPPELIHKLERQYGIREPANLPEDFNALTAMVGSADAQALREQFEDPPCM